MRFMKLGRLTLITTLALGCFIGGMSTASAQSGEIIIRTEPPAPRYESRGSVRAGYEWVPGYWQWDGRRHVWVNGHWERARAGMVWEPARWERRRGGWVFIPGRWVRAGRRTPPPPPPDYDGPRHDRDRGPYDGHRRHRRPDWRREGWVMLGEQWVAGRRDRDVIPVGNTPGGFGKLLLVAEDSDIEMHDILITFLNGERWSPRVRHYFREDRRSRTIYLPRAPRRIRSIEFRYGNIPGGGRARIQVWAK
jgi:WXXGXW repeat (2 copies)